MISGSYSPGYVYLFKGLGKGEYAKSEKLLFTTGKPVNVGYASAVAVTDWNRDGRLDLVVGNISGEVWFVPNESRDQKLAFGAKTALVAGGSEVQTNGDAGPLVADWDGDGVPDLLVGSSDGSVVLYRGSGKEGAPVLGDEEALIPPLPENREESIRCEIDPATGRLRPPAVERPGIRTKLAVHDWNGDGKLDLLVGDAVTTVGPEPELSEQQKKERADLEAEAQKNGSEISKLYQKAQEQAKRESKAEEDISDPDLQERLSERADEILSKDEQYRAAYARSEALWSKLKLLQAARDTHGFVWVYLRTADVPPPARGVASETTQLPPDSKDAILAFRVTSKETGKPLRSVAITAMPKELPASFSWRDSKRSKGTFKESLRPDEQGRVEFIVPSGVGIQVDARDRDKFEARGSQAVSALAAGERRELRFAIATEEDLVYHGRVVRGSDGAPVAGARVRITSARRSYGGVGDEMRETWSTVKLGETTSDADGRFRVGVKTWEGPHLRIEADGFAFKLVALTTGHETADKAEALRLESQATVRARVLDASGNPMPGVAVVLGAHGYEVVHAGASDDLLMGESPEVPDEEWKGTTGADGACRIERILPGIKLSLRLQQDGKTLRKDPIGVELAPGEDRAMEWKVGAGCKLTGKLLDASEKPVAGQRILLAAPQGSSYFQGYEGDEVVGSATTDDAGRFVFDDVQPGKWKVGPAARPYGQTSADPDAVAPLAQDVEIGVGGVRELVLRAWKGQYIRGTVLAPDGSPATEAYVTAETDDLDHLTSCNLMGADTFTLGPLAPGEVKVVARDFGKYAASEPVRAEPGAKDVVVRLREGGRVRVNVVDAKTGAPCAAEMTFGPEEPAEAKDRMDWGMSSPTGEDGKLDRAGILLGRYAIGARTRDGRFGVLSGIEVTTEKEPATREIRVSPGGKLRVRYEGKQPQVFVTLATQGVDVGYFAPIQTGATVEQPAPAGNVTLKIYREFTDAPRTKEVVVAQGETKELVLRDEE